MYCDEGQTFLKPFLHSQVVSPNTIRRAIGSTPLDIVVINNKQNNSFENNFDTHTGEQLMTGVFPIFGNF